MALSRRGGPRADPPIWSGFVDAMTTLLLVLMFVLTIFTVAQSVLRETITNQDSELDSLAAQVAGLANALGLQTRRAEAAEAEAGRLGSALTEAQAEAAAQSALLAQLSGQIAAAEVRIASFEAQVLTLLAERDAARGEGARLAASVAELEDAQARLISEQEALQLALAQARSEIDAGAEAARLAAAQRAALEALVAELEREAAAQTASLADLAARLTARDTEAAALSADLDAQRAAAAALAADLADREAALSEAERRRLADLAAAEALRARLADADARLSEEEARRLAEAAAAEALRERLRNADAELSAMTLALEEQRRRAEQTLTLLAAADAARKDLDLRLAQAVLARDLAREDAARLSALVGTDRLAVEDRLAQALAARLAAEQAALQAMTEAEMRAVLLSTAEARLAEEQVASGESARQVALLNQQVAALRTQLATLQGILNAAEAASADAEIQIETLGGQLNAALAQVAAEQRRIAALEAAERQRLEEEARQLERFRSEFFGQLRDVLAGREGVRIVGDRFVFSSEVLFAPGSAELAAEGRAQIARVAEILQEVAADIPPSIDWILRVDGHTDNVPLSGTGAFADNWALSQARALSVVRFLQDDLGFPPFRLAATGFGEHRPVAEGDSAAARAQNRRIELKLTER